MLLIQNSALVSALDIRTYSLSPAEIVPEIVFLTIIDGDIDLAS